MAWPRRVRRFHISGFLADGRNRPEAGTTEESLKKLLAPNRANRRSQPGVRDIECLNQIDVGYFRVIVDVSERVHVFTWKS